MICYLFNEPTYLIFTSGVPSLLYYAHIPAIVIALFAGLYAFWGGKHLLLNRLLLAISVFFSLWTISALIEWTNIHSDFMMFIWSLGGLILASIAIFSIYFIYVFLDKKDISLRIKIIFLSLLAPILFITPTHLNISGFNITTCDAFGFEWLPFKIYYTLIGLLAMVWIFVLLVRRYRVSDSIVRKQIILMGTGIEIFLFLLFVMIFLSSYLTQTGFLPDSQIEMYGLLSMPIFIVYISILTVRFRLFNIKLLAAQALMWGLTILIGSQFFFIRVKANFILNGITFLGVLILGRFLVRGVKKEVEQKEKLQDLTNQLENSNTELNTANDKLKELDKLKTEFLSLASHQLRSPLTAIKGYASMVRDGDFGEVAPKAKDAVGRIFDSSQNLTMIVEDLLNVSKIESGGMKYEKANFDMSEIVKTTAEDLSIMAGKKNIKLTYSEDNGDHTVLGDKEKLRQVVLNFIDNSIKYTKEGTIEVKLENKNDKVLVSVKDTGMGVSPEIMATLFQKFARGEGQKMNTGGSGLGLYLAKEIVDAHKGRVWVESPGMGLGSTFFIELDAVV